MKICLVATFPPSGRQLNEYAFHIARELRNCPGVELTILADELGHYEFATDADGKPIRADQQPELEGFNVIRCWKFGSVSTPARILNAVRKIKPDVVWFNLVFSSFATPENPVAAFMGLAAPALVRAARASTPTSRSTTSSSTWTSPLPASGAKNSFAWEWNLPPAHCSGPVRFLFCCPTITAPCAPNTAHRMWCSALTEHSPAIQRLPISASVAIPISGFSPSGTGAPIKD